MVVRDVTPGCDISTDDLGLRTLAGPTVAKSRRSGFECHGRLSQNMTRLVRNRSNDFGQQMSQVVPIPCPTSRLELGKSFKILRIVVGHWVMTQIGIPDPRSGRRHRPPPLIFS